MAHFGKQNGYCFAFFQFFFVVCDQLRLSNNPPPELPLERCTRVWKFDKYVQFAEYKCAITIHNPFGIMGMQNRKKERKKNAHVKLKKKKPHHHSPGWFRALIFVASNKQKRRSSISTGRNHHPRPHYCVSLHRVPIRVNSTTHTHTHFHTNSHKHTCMHTIWKLKWKETTTNIYNNIIIG